MRKLMWLSLGFGAACAVGAYLLSGAILFWVGAALAAAAVTGLVASRSSIPVKAAAVICLGFSVGLIWYQLYDTVYLNTAREADEKILSVSMRATDYSYETAYGVAVDGKVSLFGKDYSVRIYMNADSPVTPGTAIHGEFRFRYTASGGMQAPTYHRGEGIFLVAYPAGDVTAVSPTQRSWRYIPAYLREFLLQTIDGVFPEDVRPFSKALLMGDATEFDYDTNTHLMLSGIRHVAAVSGLHVSILFSMVYFATGRRRFLTAVLGVPCLALFAAMAGFSPSILRACIMQTLMLVAMACKKEYDPPTALAFAVLVMLVGNPHTVTSVGFQLSAGSVAGIFLFSGRIRAWLLDPKRLGGCRGKGLRRRLINNLCGSVSITLSAMVFTTPLVAWYFGAVSLVGVVTNLLCLWAVSILFCGIIFACILGMLYLPAAKLAGWALAWLARYILGVSSALSRVPGGVVYTESVYIVLWLILCYVLLCVFLVARQKRPVVLAACTVLSLCIALLASWAEPLLDDYRVTVLDVGQGQCVLLQSQGRTYMVDCGGSDDEAAADKAAALLMSQGVYRLDGLILSHYDRDHVGGAAYLLSRIPTDVLILPQGEDAPRWDGGLVDAYGDTPVRAEQDIQITWGDAAITVFAAPDAKTSNENSLCVLFQKEEYDILITGDRNITGEISLLQTAGIPKLDALIVGHHGSGSSSGEIFLNAARPDVAVISVGADNPYGHPARKVLERLAAAGCSIRRTDLEGTIILRG